MADSAVILTPMLPFCVGGDDVEAVELVVFKSEIVVELLVASGAVMFDRFENKVKSASLAVSRLEITLSSAGSSFVPSNASLSRNGKLLTLHNELEMKTRNSQ